MSEIIGEREDIESSLWLEDFLPLLSQLMTALGASPARTSIHFQTITNRV